MATAENYQILPFHYDLLPGYIYVNREPALITSILGSAVAVCLWDSLQGFGGMSHFRLPRPGRGDKPTAVYGLVAVATLIRMLLRMGARQENLRAQIFGGGQRDFQSRGIGPKNVKMAHKVLKRHGIPVVSEDVGGVLARRVLFHTRTNEALCMKSFKSGPNLW